GRRGRHQDITTPKAARSDGECLALVLGAPPPNRPGPRHQAGGRDDWGTSGRDTPRPDTGNEFTQWDHRRRCRPSEGGTNQASWIPVGLAPQINCQEAAHDRPAVRGRSSSASTNSRTAFSPGPSGPSCVSQSSPRWATSVSAGSVRSMTTRTERTPVPVIAPAGSPIRAATWKFSARNILYAAYRSAKVNE